MKFIVAGKGHGLLEVEWTPEETKITPMDVGIETPSPFSVARRGNEMIFSPNQQTLYRWRPGLVGLSQLLTHSDVMDWHGAVWDEQGYYATSSSYGLAWYPTCPETEDFAVGLCWLAFEYDRAYHVNAVLKKDGFFYLSYHRLTQKTDAHNSVVMKFEPHLEHFKPNKDDIVVRLTDIEQYEVGKDIHDLVDVPGHGIITSSSMENIVRGVDFDYFLPILPTEKVGNPYIRGLYYHDGILVVGKSHYSAHEDKRRFNCQIDLYDFETQKFIDSIDLPNKGTIHQIIGSD